MFGIATRRFPLLRADHPLVVRESRRIKHRLPKPLNKLGDPWTMLGYAALIHGAFFALSLVGFQKMFTGLSDLMLPFLTPFGTPIAAAFLHSILYWTLLIGLTNYTTFLVSRDVSTHTWDTLRLTPFTVSDVLYAKLIAAAYMWGGVVRALILTRLVAVLILPAAVMFQQRTSDGRPLGTLDLISAIVFIAQPLVDGLLVMAISAAAAFVIRSTTWSRLGTYGIVALVYGGLSGLGSFWLIFRSPMGALAGVLTPLAHWSPLAAAVLKPQSAQEFMLRTFMMVLIYFILPLVVALVSLGLARRFARNAS
jgi:hypothetical protein